MITFQSVGMNSVVLRLARKDIAYMKFILEGYDGLGIMRTLDPYLATVVIEYPEAQHDVLAGLIHALKKESIVEEVLSWHV